MTAVKVLRKSAAAAAASIDDAAAAALSLGLLRTLRAALRSTPQQSGKEHIMNDLTTEALDLITATAAQHRLMFRLWNQFGISDRETQLWVSSLWLGRNIESSRSLTKSDATVLIDLLLTTDCPAVDCPAVDDVDDTATTYDPEEDLF